MSKASMANWVYALIVILIAAFPVACGDRQEPPPVDSLLQLVPQNADTFTSADLERLRDERLDDLEWQLADLVDAERLDEWGIDIDDVDSLIISDPDSGDALTLLRGVFSMEDIEDALGDEGFRDNSYREIAVWSERRGDVALALVGDDVVVIGGEERVEEALGVFLDDARSAYHDDETTVIVDALEDALLYTVAEECEYRACRRSASGVRMERGDLAAVVAYSFRDEDAAFDAEREIEDGLEEVVDDPDVSVDGALVIAVSPVEEDQLGFPDHGVLRFREKAEEPEQAAQQPVTAPAPTPYPTTTAQQPATAPVPTPYPTAAQTPEPAAMEAQTDSVSGGTLVRLWRDPPTLDPHLVGDTTSAGIIVEVFGGLTTIDGQLEIVPDLAEWWDVSDGGLTYTFGLRDDIEFHDGRAVTADDLKWSMERATDPATAAPTISVFLGDIAGVDDKLEGNAFNISGVKVIDQKTISITADAPKAYLLAKLSYPTSFVLDRNNLEGNDDWFKQPNGTGPFLLDEYIPGELIRLTANKNYHLGAPHVGEVMHILSGGDALLMYENNEIHVTEVGLTSLDAILDPSNPLSTDVQRSPPSFSTYFMGLNAKEPPFDDKNVRLALNYAIDRDTISETLLRGLLVPANGVLPPGFPGFDPNLGGYEYDPEKAKRLLAESKYGSNMEDFPHIVLSLPGSFGASVGPPTEAILAMWQETLGIEVEVLQTEWATYLQDQHEGRFQMYGGSGWVADYPDPENFLDVLLHSESVDNHTNYANPEVDRLLEQARTEQDQAKRFDLYNQAEKLIVADAPWVPLWHGDSGYVLVKPNVKDYFLFPMVIPRLRHVQITGN